MSLSIEHTTNLSPQQSSTPSPSRIDGQVLSYSNLYPPPSCPKPSLKTPLSASWSQSSCAKSCNHGHNQHIVLPSHTGVNLNSTWKSCKWRCKLQQVEVTHRSSYRSFPHILVIGFMAIVFATRRIYSSPLSQCRLIFRGNMGFGDI